MLVSETRMEDILEEHGARAWDWQAIEKGDRTVHIMINDRGGAIIIHECRNGAIYLTRWKKLPKKYAKMWDKAYQARQKANFTTEK